MDSFLKFHLHIHEKVVERLFAEGQLEVGVTQKFTRLKAIVVPIIALKLVIIADKCWYEVWDGPGPQGVPELPVYSFNDYLKLGDDTADYGKSFSQRGHLNSIIFLVNLEYILAPILFWKCYNLWTW